MHNDITVYWPIYSVKTMSLVCGIKRSVLLVALLSLGGCSSYNYVTFPTDEGRLDKRMRHNKSDSEYDRRHTNSAPTQEELWTEKESPTPYQYFNSRRITADNPEFDYAARKDTIADTNREKLNWLYGQEYAQVEKGKKNTSSVYIGLTLSGGGVRSAAFSSGVLAGLNEIGVLQKIGYLSTVSGGGYAGGWYMTHLNCGAVTNVPKYLFRRGGIHLQHLNQNGSYLTTDHFSKKTDDLLGYGFKFMVTLPYYWLINCGAEIPFRYSVLRNTYRDGIGRGFLYEIPCRVAPDENSYMKDVRINELMPTQYRPFWIVNTHISLKDSVDHHKNRTGDLFEITPLWGGGDTVGYVCNDGKVNEWKYVPNALAISGAAVDSHSLQQGTFTSAMESFFGLDLGEEIDGFAPWFNKNQGYSSVFKNSLFYATGLLQLPRIPFANKLTKDERGHTEWARYYHLSDGGHFDNLGLYALVRRGCRLIIVSDASCDQNVSNWDSANATERAKIFEDLRAVEMKLEADFGAKLEMQWDSFSALPSRTNAVGDAAIKYADTPATKLLWGRIRNLPIKGVGGPSGDMTNLYNDVTILYIKAAYNNDTQLLRSYGFIDKEKADRPCFPHESTANQFLNEQQVEAYRTLAREMVLANVSAITQAVSTIEQRRESHKDLWNYLDRP